MSPKFIFICKLKTHDLFGILIHIDKSWETFKENSNVEISSWTTQNNKLAECFIKYISKQLKLAPLTQTVEENIKKMISKLLLSSEKILIADFINSKTKKKNYPTLQLYSLKKIKLIVSLFIDTHIPEFFDLICSNVKELPQLSLEERHELCIHLNFYQTKTLLDLNSKLIQIPELIDNFQEKKWT